MNALVGEKAGSNIQDRAAATVNLVENEINTFREAIKNVRERIGIPGKEPSLPKKAGVPGRKASLVELPLALLIDSADNATEFCLRQAEITRRWVKR